MYTTIIQLPCTAKQLEAALHSICDHHGTWDQQIVVSRANPYSYDFTIQLYNPKEPTESEVK